MKTWFKQLVQDQDGEADEMAIIALGGFLVFVIGTLYNIDKFDPQTFGIGLASIGALAAGMGVKHKLEGKDDQ